MEDAVAKAVRESNFSKAKEIQQKIDKIVMEKTASNQNSLQGEKNFRLPIYVKKTQKLKVCFDFEENKKHTGKSLSEVLLFAEHGENMLCTKIVVNVRTNFYTLISVRLRNFKDGGI